MIFLFYTLAFLPVKKDVWSKALDDFLKRIPAEFDSMETEGKDGGESLVVLVCPLVVTQQHYSPRRRPLAPLRDGGSRAPSLENKELWNNDHSREQISQSLVDWYRILFSFKMKELNPCRICFCPNQGKSVFIPPDFFFCSHHSTLF